MNEIKFISTKLLAPSPRKNYLLREQLFSKLQRMDDYKIAVVQGPAGSGKTTLITSFLKEFPKTNYRWIQLDEGNNDLFSFWYYFLAAVQDDLGRKVEEDLQTIFAALPQKQDIENMLILIINQLQTPLTIVLDDFHTIKDASLIRSVEFFMKYCSEQLRLILLTREKPRLYLGDFMMADKYLEINDQDLKFSDAEAAHFLQRTLSTGVNNETVSELNELTEGWVGGLQLLALATSSHRRELQLENIQGLNTYLIHYLSNEILLSLNEEEMQFLLQTSILNYFDVSICNRLLEIDHANELIHRLIERNLFLVVIDEKAGLYRYHHLFGEFLRLRLAEGETKRKNELHVKVGNIYLERGDLEESVKHYFEAKHFREALEVIAQMRHHMTGWTYLRQIPLPYLAENRDLAFQRLFYHFCNVEIEQCREVLDYLQDIAEDDIYWSLLQFTRLSIDSTAVDLELDTRSIALIKDMGLADITEAIIYVTGSMLLGFRDQYDKALEYINQAIKLNNTILNPYLCYFALTCKAQLLESIGELQECVQIYEQLFQLVEKYPYLAPLSANDLIGVAGIYMKKMQLDEAERYFQQAKQRLNGHPSMAQAYSYNILEMSVLRGEQLDVGRQVKLIGAYDLYYDHPIYHSSLLKQQLVMDRVDPKLLHSFVDWVEQTQQERPLRYEDRLTFARVLLYEGKLNQAIIHVDNVLKQARKQRMKLVLVEALLLKTHILQKGGEKNHRDMLNLMREAVHYSYANEIAYPYIWEGKFVHHVLTQLLEEKAKDLSTKEKVFISRIISLWAQQEKREDLLSEREQEVLQILATGLSNKEIANKLYISVATVKTHLMNIYAKLDVSTRMEAVEKARRRGLLS